MAPAVAPSLESPVVQQITTAVAEDSQRSLLKGTGQRVKVYYVQVRDGTVQLIEKIADTCSSLRSSTREKVQVYYVQAKDGTLQVTGKINDSFSALCESAKTSLEPRVQILRPHYMRMHNGVAHICATVGEVPVVIKVKVSEISGGVQSQVLKALTAAQLKLQPLTNPVMNRVTPVWNATTDRVDRFSVSVKDGVLSIKGAMGSRMVNVTAKLTDVISAIRTRANGGLTSVRTAISDLTSQLLDIATKIYGKTDERARLLYTSFHDGVFQIAAQFKDQTFVLKATVSDFRELVQSTGKQLYSTSYADMKAKVQQAAEIAKAKSSEAKDGLRSLAANEKAQVTAKSAAGGAVVLGAGGGAVGTGLGVVFAPFTLGLSIPIGFCVGTAAGGTAGLVTGGAAGYHKESIGNGLNAGISKAKQYKSIASASTAKLCTQVIGSTGSTFA